MQRAADDESEHVSYVRRVKLAFSADWPALASDVMLRALAFDAMQNAARGIDRFAAAAPPAPRSRPKSMPCMSRKATARS